MNTTSRIKAQRFGHWLGRRWRGYLCGDRRVSGWLTSKGLPETAASALLWTVKVIVLLVLFYTAFWLTLIMVFTITAAWLSDSHAKEEHADFLGSEAEEIDHRESLFYDPINYNDDPDPRFEDH
ncbi:Protein of unknown function [Halopseudomonas litoralis]|uniref:DUF3742 family protein n=1 Tax=Halopseudomonas litoralis TaxID=797277 RepID=A0A1H1QCR8_9GAMM|nr:DUF3742 family protein [Halopseudomonas litoralis]SDS20669.1 Protein of unknown function [Halopseudomonas litoralis]